MLPTINYEKAGRLAQVAYGKASGWAAVPDTSRSRGDVTVRSVARALGVDSDGGHLLFAAILFGVLMIVGGLWSVVGGGQGTSWWQVLLWAMSCVAIGVASLYSAWRILLRRVARASAMESLPDEAGPAATP